MFRLINQVCNLGLLPQDVFGMERKNGSAIEVLDEIQEA